MKPRLYLETTIPSYLVSRPSKDLIVAGHQSITQDWWNTRRSAFDLYISQFVIDEASDGDQELSKKRLQAIAEFELLEITSEVTDLAEAMILAKAVPKNAATDAFHIAIAAFHSMQFLMTWNCKHIGNAEMWPMINAVCAEYGYKCPAMCTPESLMGVL